MSIRAVAVVPGAPLLVPELAGAADPLAGLRARCVALVRGLGDGPVVLLGAGPETRWWDDVVGTFAPWGAPTNSQCGRRSTTQVTTSLHNLGVRAPLSLLVGAWLGSLAGVDVAGAWSVAAAWSDAGAVGEAHVADEVAPSVPDGSALLVVAGGSAARGDKPPAGPHPDAERWDDALAAALAGADVAALAAYDPPAALRSEGAPAFRALATLAAGSRWAVDELTHEAPYGVAYVTARWTPET